jgi:hypothetical protein
MVNILLTERQRKFISGAHPSQVPDGDDVHRLSRCASLVCRETTRRMVVASNFQRISADTVTSAVHRFQESIAGRPYLIEVSAVSKDRWRAYIVRLPGVPTALMPFYGTTPADACRQLCEWLTRAHAKASNPTGSV